MSSKPALLVAPCDHKAAAYAVKHWHYSGKMPAGRLLLYGVWEEDVFLGCVMFGKGANNNLSKCYNLQHTQACELVRVALRAHHSPVSRIVSVCLRLLRKQCPGLRLIISYADSEQGHHGGIYQAGNWLYLGPATPQASVWLQGKKVHKRVVSARYGHCSVQTLRARVDPHAMWVPDLVKHTYVMPLDKGMREALGSMRKPYPKRATSIGADAPGFQPGEGGSQPTVALQNSQSGH